MAKTRAVIGKTNLKDCIHALIKPTDVMATKMAIHSKMRVFGSRAIKTATMAIEPSASFVLGSRRRNSILQFLNFRFFRLLPKYYVQVLLLTRRATRRKSIIAASLGPSVVSTKFVAQARFNLLTAIHELKVAQMLFVLQPSSSMQFFGTANQELSLWQKPEEP